jgi:uncharacterized RDD family membrane protein YckC
VIGKRIGGALIDVLISAAVSVLIFLVNHDTIDRGEFGGLLDELSCSDAETPLCIEVGDSIWYAEGGKAAAVYGLTFLAFVANHVILQGATGASIGKHAVGLRVVKRETGRLASIGTNAVRELVGIVDRLCFWLPGLIMVLTTKGHRRLGDMAANTVVVGKESVGSPPIVPGLTAPQFTGSPYASSYPPSSPMSPPQPASPTGWPPPTPGASAPPPPTGSWEAPSAQGAPPPTGSWEAPAAPHTPPLPPGASATSNTPTWDPQRNTYVLFDAAQNQWVQWNADAQQWRPLS